MTAGNDVVDLSKWDGKVSVNIGDAFSNDNDKVAVMASSLAGTNSNLKLTSIENLEIINAKETKALNLVGENFKGLESIKLKGDATTLNVSGFTYGVKIDATENADIIFGGFKADTINGGAGNDTIVGNDGNDVLTGGNGADEFVVGTVKTAGVDQILDFSAEDKISMAGFSAQELKKFDASTFSTVTYKTLDSVLATFAAGGANVTKANDVVIFSYNGKTYALLANGPFTETGSALVDITGANVASLTESNFGEPTPTPTPQGKTYSTYTDFKIDADLGYIAEGQQVGIATVTGAEAGILATNKTYLDKIAAGGIKSVTSDIVVTVGTGADGLSNNFDATEFETKLAVDAVGSGIVMNINGSKENDIIVASSFGGTITGGPGADIISLGAGVDVVKYSGTGETASVGSGNVAVASIVATVKAAQGADTINNVKAGDKIDISAVAGDSAKLVSSGNVIQSSEISSATLTDGVDVLLIKDNTDYFLVYENSGTKGSANSLGANAEVIKLVGLTDNNTITFDKGIVTIA